ncbi:hypothetical protein TBR22_A04870 [Luteitalea sp. TBR-22]|uniref:hypothetical protein n=1 Tax=Luteitalea sp. TBR-22 TaxID=2802971 RepID=UPI001AF15183|nr:hypothetical protein [Luteitalea sp. TBR-22]BCS31287.1 hypothetical protein TBR22_A04870 [Luteitalea sp. TBR-22]
MRASKLQPALVGGLVIGVLSALPVISMGNCLCCAWVVLGGVVATYLLQQAQPTPVDGVDAAITGALAGVAGAVFAALIAIPVHMITGPMGADVLQRLLDQGGNDIPPEMRGTLQSLARGGVGGVISVLSFLLGLCVNAIFASLGGLLGMAIFKPSAPPPPPVPGFVDPGRPHAPEQ